MLKRFHNRTEAGQILAQHLTAYTHREDLLVLGLPRGGVPVAFEVAKKLNAPLDVCIVRKLGVPGHKELAMGAIAMLTLGEASHGEGIANQGMEILNYDVINALGIDRKVIEIVAAEELQELKRRDRTYRGNAPPLNVKNKTVILIDDGIATGSTMRAAIAILKQQQPTTIVVAVPVAPTSTYQELQLEVDNIVCLQTPKQMSAIGFWYEDFSQTTDEEVRALLAKQSDRRKLSD
ncbi:phosphoribosyltransferase [Anabaena cylindrica FACHB-243]|uniref:Phosphoribosyltransferase n=1 Tax=Anabaena cylindrica (strain ATCC 27899 / PCC 7122) TaxID=272123 RepID=K9ZK72_ANACC|nr:MULTISPECIES: phosphoribosyltransferase [Anabaena]AFZ59643.1 phosphoribosyltransferase [Anabaena cylindrica PCC 7122]MBD2418695.1 phosphoribosyltransferase [Anabaena cylindrica FACHB-243]MBY5281678.1 phosphoribosyltransferase [Anabaena sp. CCAP 1446/1C]MBY5309204.1 phosphoribosyltransferase [Anabaena sp. CCAP 1446/1C]MCM2406257.1 phosphoribosyltransferase [Anabaena sp. CCAP 1446/1C]